MVLSSLLIDESSEIDAFEAVLRVSNGGQKRVSVEEVILTFSGISSIFNVEDSNERLHAMIWSMISMSSCCCTCRRAMHLRQREASFCALCLRRLKLLVACIVGASEILFNDGVMSGEMLVVSCVIETRDWGIGVVVCSKLVEDVSPRNHILSGDSLSSSLESSSSLLSKSVSFRESTKPFQFICSQTCSAVTLLSTQ